MRRIAVLLAVPLLVFLGAKPAAAHPMPHSVVLLDVHETSVTASLELPAGDLATASGIATDLPARAAELRAYLAAHVRPAGADGAAWTVTVGDPELTAAEQTATGPYQEVAVEIEFAPPAGGDVRHFTLGYDVIVHKVVTHTTLVSVRQDWAAGRITECGETEQVGVIAVDNRTMTVPKLTVDLGAGSSWQGFLAMLRLGGLHILEGTDHLLFLLILLLPAPLIARRGRWTGAAGPRRAIRRIGWITLAFTLGHSVALVLSALFRVQIPARPVEVFIAVSILIGAAHAVRPLFPGQEALVAGLFGLGHGMAFSFTLAGLQLSTGQLALSLLGFNLGIELVQLLLVALALPALLALARLPVQPWLRIGGAALTGAAAVGWVLDRLGVSNPVAETADAAGANYQAMLVVLTIMAMAGIGRLLIARKAATA
ncbi:HupE/UreJ family protein [Actinoplanes philippinensis]|uniref:HupE/UreJ family protein n=1 Tax=Actinoplanes philippinensis TaxID=35752 RepID=UPI0015A62BF6|nr:HupE/UreJ family protein [Actinoplanes philippinensis]